MKKISMIIMSAVLFMTLALASCAQSAKTDDASPSAGEPSVEPTTAQTSPNVSQPAESAAPSVEPDTSPARMNGYGLVFGGAEDEFFGAYENTDRALDALEPLLFSAVWATMDVTDLFHVENAPVDAGFEWTTVYHLVNDYGFEQDGVTAQNGDLVATIDVMEGFFKDAFAADTIPPIEGEMAGLISFDGAPGLYTFTSADGGGMTFVLKSIALSLSSAANDGSHSATLQFDIVLNDGSVDRALAVEIIPSDASSYHYSILAAYPVEESSVPNPLRESSAQEIMDTLGLSFTIPDRAEDVVYYIVDVGDASLAQADFTLDGLDIVYRLQATASFTDISGAYKDWANAESVQINYSSGEVYYNDSGSGVCLWYDAAPGLMYAVYMSRNANVDTLTALGNELFVPVQGDA